MDKLIIENFRSISDKIEIDLTRINILTGPNNSGKSNVLKILLVYNDYLNSGNHFILAFDGKNSEKHKIDCYQNAVNWVNWEHNKSIKLSFERNNYFVSFEFIPNDSMKLVRKSAEIQTGRLRKFEFLDPRNNSRISITNISGNDYDLYADPSIITDLWLGKDFDKNDHDTRLRFESDEKIYLKQIERIIEEISKADKKDEEYQKKLDSLGFYFGFYQNLKYKLDEFRLGKNKNPGSMPVKMRFNISKINESDILTLPSLVKKLLEDYFRKEISKTEGSKNTLNMQSEIYKLSQKIKEYLSIEPVHLNPDRSNQARIYMNSDNSKEIGRIIATYKLKPLKKSGRADKFLIKWLKNLGIGDGYRFRSLEGIATAIELKDKSGWHNLVDKGFGIGQIFSILFRIGEYIEKNNSLNPNFFREMPVFPVFFCIEEPEANLHPKFQSILADVLLDAVDNTNLKFIIETHSEYFIRRFQFLVADAKKKLSNSDVRVLYFQDPDLIVIGNEQVYDLEIRPDGIMKNDFGPGFFDEATRLTIDLLKQQKSN